MTAEELVVDELDIEAGSEDLDEDEMDALLETAEELLGDPAEARFVLTAGQALAFGESAEELMSAGARPAGCAEHRWTPRATPAPGGTDRVRHGPPAPAPLDRPRNRTADTR